MPQLVILNLHFSQEMTSTPKFPGTDVSLEKKPEQKDLHFPSLPYSPDCSDPLSSVNVNLSHPFIETYADFPI